LGLLLAAGPDQQNFTHGLGLAAAAVAAGVEVYVYCLDEAVRGIDDDRLQRLRVKGLRLYACAEAARRRGLPLTDHAVFAGLAALAELVDRTDRFVSFN
jgi:sulfur relay (sulfurtransferase) complex TusBCD TusD component (DsrE family)